MPDQMSDAELIALLRRRVTALETAVMDYEDAMKPVGAACKAAYEWALPDAGLGLSNPVISRVVKFFDAYRDTLPARQAAAEALLMALRSDFKTAILTASDISEETRQYWLAVGAEAEAEASPEVAVTP